MLREDISKYLPFIFVINNKKKIINMARFMDNHTPVPPIGLNGYNKICFTNSKDAESMLINKPLMPG